MSCLFGSGLLQSFFGSISKLFANVQPCDFFFVNHDR
ncbi:hypothetical protein ABH994_005478 [Bradyrhizobium yuanmingense]